MEMNPMERRRLVEMLTERLTQAGVTNTTDVENGMVIAYTNARPEDLPGDLQKMVQDERVRAVLRVEPRP